MLGIIYLMISGILGYEITEGLLGQRKADRMTGINRIWFVLPVAFGTGTLMMTWAVYVVSWLFSVCAGAENPLFYGNLAAFLVTICGLCALFICRKRKGEKSTLSFITDRKRFVRELVFFGILLSFVTYMMFYVFWVKDGILYSGFTVYGDYAPHTAMMRSFSLGNNFPTQYPHFGGEDVKYHFMFQFFTGNLEYLGLRIDIAYNIVSSISLVGFLMILYLLAVRITGKMSCGVIAAVLFFFRSGAAFFRFVWEHAANGDLLNALAENTSFIGYTANENWGLWNFNVYLNQRHLAFGLLLAAAAIWIYMDWLDAGISHPEKGGKWLYEIAFTKKAWKSRNLDTALMLGVILGLSAFWNGAALIGGLLILMGFGIFSDGKLDYAVTAAVTVFFSMLQSKIFVKGHVTSPAFQFGFLADEKSLWGTVIYLFWMSGVFFLGLLVLQFFLKRRERVIMLSFLFPLIFAFTVSLTPDINVNHKYIMISYAFLTIFWAWAVCVMCRKNPAVKAAAVILVICLTATGVYDFVVILKGNGPGRRAGVRLESDTTEWLSENLDKNDLILTPEYSMNEVTMAGVMMYCGWPYYAWSAGYDTNYRAARAVEIYTTDNKETLRNTVEQEKITYILYQEDMEFEQRECREDVIAETYPKVYSSEDGSIRIYETR